MAGLYTSRAVRRIPLVCGAFLVALGLVALVETFRLRDGWLGARLMPAVVGASLVVLGLAHRTVPAAAPAWPDAAGGRRVVATLALLAGYVAVFPGLGFLPATVLLVLPLVRALGRWSWPLTVATTAAIALACHVVFKHWLGMPLPPGLLAP
jgi:putative tricarboxylic transport membrane protein